MKRPAVKPRVLMPPLWWLLLSIASFIVAIVVWQDQRIERLRPAPRAKPVPSVGAAAADPVAEPAPNALASPEGSTSGTTTATPAGTTTSPARQLDPQAGRQVLRCTSKGRVTYRDLNAGCPEGSSEKVTVFPTEGVGKPQ